MHRYHVLLVSDTVQFVGKNLLPEPASRLKHLLSRKYPNNVYKVVPVCVWMRVMDTINRL